MRTFFVFCCHTEDLLQFLDRKRHRRRSDRSHPHRSLIFRDPGDRIPAAVAEVVSLASVEMQVNKPRYRVHAFPVKDLIFCLRSLPLCINLFDRSVLYDDPAVCKLLILCKNLHMINNHYSCLPIFGIL